MQFLHSVTVHRFFGSKIGAPPQLLCIAVAIFLFVGTSYNYSQVEVASSVSTASSYSTGGASNQDFYAYSSSEYYSSGRALSEFSEMAQTTTASPTSFLGFLASAFMCLTVCQVRQAIRKRDAIPESHCQGCEDLCCAWCCNPCTQCLIMRHEGLVKGKYSLTSPIGNLVQV